MKENLFYFFVCFCLLVMAISCVIDTYNLSVFFKSHSQYVELGDVVINPNLK